MRAGIGRKMHGANTTIGVADGTQAMPVPQERGLVRKIRMIPMCK